METGIKAKGKGLRHLLVGIVVVILVATYFTVKNIEKIIDMYAPYKEAEQGGKNVRMKEFLKMRGEASKEMNRNAPSSTALSIPVQKQETLKVKGLYIGMDIYEAYNICKQLLEGSKYSVSDITEDTEHIKFFSLIGGYVSADKDGKVTLLYFTSVLVDYLFNAGDMEVTDFVQKFANSYHVPEFKVKDLPTFYANEQTYSPYYYYYDSPAGFRVKIDNVKNLTIEKIASAQEQKFD